MFSRFAIPTSFSRASSLKPRQHASATATILYDIPSGHPHSGNCIIRVSTFSKPAFLISSSSLRPILPFFSGWMPCRYSWDLSIVNYGSQAAASVNIPPPKAMT